MGTLRELWQYRDVLVNFVRRDLKLRYKSSVLGFVWSMLLPLAQVVTFVIIFKYIMRLGEENYSVLLMSAFFPWMFFSQAVLDGAVSFAANVGLLKRVYFPRLILPLTTLGSNLVHFLFAMLVLCIYFAYVRVTVNWGYLPLAALAMVIQVAFTFGLMLFVGSLSVFYSDVKFLLTAVFQMWMFFSPIVYPVRKVLETGMFPQWVKTAYFLNPMTPLLMAYRGVVPLNEPHKLLPQYWQFLGVSAAVAIAVLVIGYVVFRRYEWEFAVVG